MSLRLSLPGIRRPEAAERQLVGEAGGVSDRRFFALLCLLLLAVALLPVVAGWLNTPAGHQYSGFLAGRDDYYTYLAKMRAGWEGDWLFSNRYSLEAHRPVFIFTFYLVAGHVCRWLGLPLWVGYHLSRAVLLPLALYACWRFIGTQVVSPAQRRQALVLGFFLSGFFILSDQTEGLLRIETHLAEHFYLAQFYPHYLVDCIALCWGFVLFQRQLLQPDWRHYLYGGLSLWLLALVHPFMALPALAIPGLYALVFRRNLLWRAWVYLCGITLSVLPLMGYMAWALYGDPVLSTWRQQAVAHFAIPWLEPLWFGLGLPLAAVGAWLLLRRPEHREGDPEPVGRFALTWVLVALALVNLPLIKNRLEFGLFLSIPVAILAVRALARLQERLVQQRWQRIVFWGAVPFALCFSSMIVVLSSIASGLHPNAERLINQWYVSDAYQAGMQYLAAHSDRSTVVVATYTAANQAPAFAPVRVYAGHMVETIDFWNKREVNNRFYRGAMSQAEAADFLRNTGATYVLEDRYSTYDFANLKGDLQPLASGLDRYRSLLHPAFSNSDITVYQVAVQ